MQSKLKRDQIYDQILLDIICGELRSGENIDVESLAERYKVGQAGVRDALFKLSVEGQVERRPRLGSVVANPSLIEYQQVFSLRAQLEGQAARLAAENATKAEMQEIAGAYAKAEQAIAQSDWKSLVEFDMKFHQGIAKGTHNRIIRRVMPELQNIALRFWHYVLPRRPVEALVREVGYHRAVAAAIVERNPKAAEAAMKAVLEEFPSTVQGLFTTE